MVLAVLILNAKGPVVRLAWQMDAPNSLAGVFCLVQLSAPLVSSSRDWTDSVLAVLFDLSRVGIPLIGLEASAEGSLRNHILPVWSPGVAKSLLLNRLSAKADGQVSSPTL